MHSFLADFAACLAFWSRIPIPARFMREQAPNFTRIVRALPAAGLVIGAPATAALALAYWAQLPLFTAAVLALAVLSATTGALHEDGLSDCADSLGGRTREHRLEIMKDSRIGAFGALALVFSVLLRAGALAALMASNPLTACLAFWGLASFSRVASLLPLAVAPPARKNGLGVLAQHFDKNLIFAGFGALLCFAPVWAVGESSAKLSVAIILSLGAVAVVAPFAKSRYGGATGDVAGAAEQICEIVFLLALSARL